MFLANLFFSEQIAKHCLLTQNKRRLAPGSPGLVVRSFGCHHAENGRIHRKNVVDCPLVINSLGDNPFQTRPDQEWGIIGQASLLHSRPWALLRRISSVCWSWVASPTHYVPWHLFFSACGVVGPKLLWSAPNLAFASSESMLNLLKRNDIINGISSISNILAIFVSFLEKLEKELKIWLIIGIWNILLWCHILVCLTFDNIFHNIMCGQKATKRKQILRPK